MIAALAPRFPATWLSETYARSDTLSKGCQTANWQMLEKNKYVIYLPRSVRIGQNCLLSFSLYGPPAGK